MPLHIRSKSLLLKVVRNKAKCEHKNHIEKNHSYGGFNVPDSCLMYYDIYCKDCGKHIGCWETGMLEMFDWVYPDDYENPARCDIDFEDPFAEFGDADPFDIEPQPDDVMKLTDEQFIQFYSQTYDDVGQYIKWISKDGTQKPIGELVDKHVVNIVNKFGHTKIKVEHPYVYYRYLLIKREWYENEKSIDLDR